MWCLKRTSKLYHITNELANILPNIDLKTTADNPFYIYDIIKTTISKLEY